MIDLRKINNDNIRTFDNGFVTVNSLADIQTNLVWCDKIINNAVRSLEYWDVYRFEGSVNNSSDFLKQYNALTNNHALVINVAFDKYKIGDVVLKDNNGTQQIISAGQSGTFVPDTYVNGVITYKHVASVDPDRTIAIDIGQPIANQVVYNQRGSLTAGQIVTINNYDINITPVIKFFLVETREEVYLSYKIDGNGTFTTNYDGPDGLLTYMVK